MSGDIKPVIKWSGSKRVLAPEIIALMPREIDTYYEPFLGGGSVFIRLALSDVRVNRFVLSDINCDLMQLWEAVIHDTYGVYAHYKALWTEMKSLSGHGEKSKFYFSVRDRFNEFHNPYDFMFIMRTTFNGMPRYNKKGEFNNPLHPTRNGIIPENLLEIMRWWVSMIGNNKVEFLCQSYDKINPTLNDFVYLDPPYEKVTGMYYGKLDDYEYFWNFLRGLPCKYALSFDGKSENENYFGSVPTDVYKRHMFLDGGNSSFRRLNRADKLNIHESLYLNYATP